MKFAWILPLLAISSCANLERTDAVTAPTRHTMWHEEQDDGILVKFGEEVVTKVHYKAEPKPYLYPLYAPGEIPVTRSWPQAEGEGEERDHPHHTSFWFAHGNVNGTDFWHPQAQNGGIQEWTGRLKEVLLRGKRIRLRYDYVWKTKAGEELLAERRTILIGSEEDHRWIDLTFHMTALADEVTFEDTKEGTFALRLRPELRLRGKVATGKAQNAEGVTGKDVWGKRAAWVHYSGTIAEKAVGVAMFEHPDNFRHPTWWHARDYGLVAANPFGIHDFERKEAGAGNHVLKKGEVLELKYRVWLHTGERTVEQIKQQFEAYQVQSKD